MPSHNSSRGTCLHASQQRMLARTQAKPLAHTAEAAGWTPRSPRCGESAPGLWTCLGMRAGHLFLRKQARRHLPRRRCLLPRLLQARWAMHFSLSRGPRLGREVIRLLDASGGCAWRRLRTAPSCAL